MDVAVPVVEELSRLVIHGMLHVLGHEHPETDARFDSAMFGSRRDSSGSYWTKRGERPTVRVMSTSQDPAVASTVFLTALTDMTGFLLLLGSPPSSSRRLLSVTFRLLSILRVSP